MARRENWLSRRRKGVQGKALEYHIDSLPTGVKNLLVLREEPAIYEAGRQDPLAVWIEYYYHLSDSERGQVMAFLMREGMDSLLTWIAEKNKQ
ncbi:Mu DNA-binding domain protein [compost metagenome]